MSQTPRGGNSTPQSPVQVTNLPATNATAQDLCLVIAKDALTSIVSKRPFQEKEKVRHLLAGRDTKWPWLHQTPSEKIESYTATIREAVTVNEIKTFAVQGRRNGKSRLLHELDRAFTGYAKSIAITIDFQPGGQPILTFHREVEVLLRVSAHIIAVITNNKYEKARNLLQEAIQISAEKHNIPLNRLRFNLHFAQELFMVTLTSYVLFRSPKLTNLALLVDNAHNCINEMTVAAIQQVLIDALNTWQKAKSTAVDKIALVISTTSNVSEIKAGTTMLTLPTTFAPQRIIEDWMPVALPSWKNIFTTNIVHAHRLLAMLTYMHPALDTAMTFIELLVPHEHDLNYFTVPSNISQLIQSSCQASLYDIPSTVESVLHTLSGHYIVNIKAVHLITIANSTIDGAHLHPFRRLHDDLMKLFASNDSCTDTIWSAPYRELFNAQLHMYTNRPPRLKLNRDFRLEAFFQMSIAPSVELNLNMRYDGQLDDDRSNACMPCTLDDTSAFLQQANNVTLPGNKAVLEIHLHPQEAACGMWLMRDSSSGRSFVLIIESVSQEQRRQCAEHLNQSSSTTAANADAEGDNPISVASQDWMAGQYWESGVCSIAQTIHTKTPYRLDSLAEAMASKRFVVVMMQSWEEGPDAAEFNPQLVMLNFERAQHVLGQFHEVYEAVRRFKQVLAKHQMEIN